MFNNETILRNPTLFQFLFINTDEITESNRINAEAHPPFALVRRRGQGASFWPGFMDLFGGKKQAEMLHLTSLPAPHFFGLDDVHNRNASNSDEFSM